MISAKFSTPLSPPSSPRMSGAPFKPGEHQWPHSNSGIIGNLQTSRSYIGSIGTESSPEGPTREATSAFGFSTLNPQISEAPHNQESPDITQSAYDAGIAARSREQLTPRSPARKRRGQLYPRTGEGFVDEDEEVEDEQLDDADPLEGSPHLALTAAEIRAQKRKMKRFRLTHQQTRFLMSEFVRQAHPDAAHRQRLSREIPGLSPRQVQVWFQNRRAKLKRLNADDRERMIRSRTLPTTFDSPQTLRAPFHAPPTSIASSMTNLTTFGAHETGSLRSSTFSQDRRVSDMGTYAQYAQPSGSSSNLPTYPYFANTPSASSLVPSSSNTSMALPPNSFARYDAPPRQSHVGQHATWPSNAYSTFSPGARATWIDRAPRYDAEATPSSSRIGSYNETVGISSGQRSSSVSNSSPVSIRDRSMEQPRGPSSNASLIGPYGINYNYTSAPIYTSPISAHQANDPLSGQETVNTSIDSHYTHGSRGGLENYPGSSNTYPSYSTAQPGYQQLYGGFAGQFSGSTTLPTYTTSDASDQTLYSVTKNQ